MRSLALGCFALLLVILQSCGSQPSSTEPKTSEPAKPAAAAPVVADESRRFPLKDRVSTTVVTGHLLDKEYLPAGNLAVYRKGKKEFQAFLARTGSPTEAAILLGDIRKKLQDPKLVPSFGGFIGKDGPQTIFVFPKGKWLAGVAGLPQAEADAFAREFAARLDQ